MLVKFLLCMVYTFVFQAVAFAGDHVIDILYHPYLVHFPIAFFFLEGYLVLLWKITSKDKYEEFSYLTLRLGVITSVITMISGYIDAGGINPMVKTHFLFALSVFILNIIRWILKKKYGQEVWTGCLAYLYVLMLLVSMALVGIVGHLGGKLVFF